MIEAAGGSFHLAKCELGQSADAESYSELEVSCFLIKKTNHRYRTAVKRC